VCLIAVRCLDINQDLQLSLWSEVECKFVVLSRRARWLFTSRLAVGLRLLPNILIFCKTCLTMSHLNDTNQTNYNVPYR
jgi:hypothetical protein